MTLCSNFVSIDSYPRQMFCKITMRNLILTIPFLLLSFCASGQHSKGDSRMSSEQLLDSLWQNPISFFNQKDNNWRMLCDNLDNSDLDQLNHISQSIFYGIDAKILNQTHAFKGTLGYLNKKSHKKKNKVFSKKMRKGFRDRQRYPNHRAILMEGDSWIEYPLFLRDLSDQLIDNENLAVYSLASAGDWVANMISDRQYQLEYLKLKPDVFILSGGGNDILGDRNLASFVDLVPIDRDSPFLNDYRDYVILRSNSMSVPMCSANFCPAVYHDYKHVIPELAQNTDAKTVDQIVNGRRYINIAYYRWLVSLKLEYKIFIESLKKLDEDRFWNLMIITQGYDYPIPSFKEKFGKSMFTKNGEWIKEPLMMIGITDSQTQEDIIKAMIFDFNEMIIELGKEFANVIHMDIRGFTQYYENVYHKKQGKFWYDEIHPKSKIYHKISESYEALIFNRFKHPHKVVNAIEHHEQGEDY